MKKRLWAFFLSLYKKHKNFVHFLCSLTLQFVKIYDKMFVVSITLGSGCVTLRLNYDQKFFLGGKT